MKDQSQDTPHRSQGSVQDTPVPSPQALVPPKLDPDLVQDLQDQVERKRHKMLAADKAAWIKLLRSGDVEKIHASLLGQDQTTGKLYACGMGALGLAQGRKPARSLKGGLGFSMPGHKHVAYGRLPARPEDLEAYDTLTLTDEGQLLEPTEPGVYNYALGEFAKMRIYLRYNDMLVPIETLNDTYEISFNEMADLIEEQL